MKKLLQALCVALTPSVAHSAVLQVEQYDNRLVCIQRKAIVQLLYKTAWAGWRFENALKNIEKVEKTRNGVVPLNIGEEVFNCQVGPFVPEPMTLQFEQIVVEGKHYLMMSGVAVGDPYRKRLYSIDIGILSGLRQFKLLIKDAL